MAASLHMVGLREVVAVAALKMYGIGAAAGWWRVRAGTAAAGWWRVRAGTAAAGWWAGTAAAGWWRVGAGRWRVRAGTAAAGWWRVRGGRWRVRAGTAAGWWSLKGGTVVGEYAVAEVGAAGGTKALSLG